MWRELKVTDIDLAEIGKLRNIYGCSENYSCRNIIHNIKNKNDCHYFYYEDSDYKILIGFKLDNKYNKITYISYSIGNFGDLEYYKKAFRIIAKKTREYLNEKNNTLIQRIKGMGESNKTAVFMGGIENFLEPIKVECEKEDITMEIDYENGFFEMR